MFVSSDPSLTRLADRLRAFVIEGLCKAVAAHSAPNRHLTPLLMLLWSRLSRTVQRFDLLAAKIREGRERLAAAGSTSGTVSPIAEAATARAPTPTRTPTPPATPRIARPETAGTARKLVLPRRFGWVYRMVPNTTVFRADLEYWLDDPDLPALIAEEPRLGRLVRPLCRMLGVAMPAWLRLPGRPAGNTAKPSGRRRTTGRRRVLAPLALPRDEQPRHRWRSLCPPAPGSATRRKNT